MSAPENPPSIWPVADDEPFGQQGVCSFCGDDSPSVDEATELCEMCFEHVFGLAGERS